MSSSSAPLLSQGVGYGVVIGIGLFFSALMIALTWVQARYTGIRPDEAEEFTSASRSVKPGLIASAIVSAWTWAATLLQSSAVAYRYGISGPWWYGSGATVQVLLFAMLAAKLKLNAPYAHTFLEIIGARWGTFAHSVFMVFGLATNIIVSSMLILGGSATVTSLTGMSTIAACFLIPLGVSIYVVVGGMRSTILCDYTHTSVLLAIILVFFFTVYSTSDQIGSFSKMHSLLTAAAKTAPVPGNEGGSYLTIRSTPGLVFGLINTIGNFSTVFADQSYWMRAIASRPGTSVKAYLIGGIAWFAIPFCFATTLGLAAVALRGSPNMPILSAADVSAGLPASAAAGALMGKSGAAILVILLFLAVTSATSAELVAVSSILTYDVYKRHINPNATEAQILRMSHLMVGFYALVMALAGVIFYFIGISMGWLYTFMGTILGSAVVPIALAVTWSKANRMGCIVGALVGFGAGVTAWLVATSVLNHGVINVTTSGGNYEMLAGNVASILTGGVIAVGASLVWPDDFDFKATRALNAPPGSRFAAPSATTAESSSEKDEKSPTGITSDSEAEVQSVYELDESELDPAPLEQAFRFACWSSVVLTLVLLILIPIPLYGSRVIFGLKGFAAWATIGIIWACCSIVAVVIWPLFESRNGLAAVSKGIVKDIFSPGSGKVFVESLRPPA